MVWFDAWLYFCFALLRLGGFDFLLGFGSVMIHASLVSIASDGLVFFRLGNDVWKLWQRGNHTRLPGHQKLEHTETRSEESSHHFNVAESSTAATRLPQAESRGYYMRLGSAAQRSRDDSPVGIVR